MKDTTGILEIVIEWHLVDKNYTIGTVGPWHNIAVQIHPRESYKLLYYLSINHHMGSMFIWLVDDGWC
jgi:hypothetical protein